MTSKNIYMKRMLLVTLALLFTFASCTEQDFEESYANPAKISVSSVEKQFAGFLQANREYVVPSYWNYFVVLRTTVNRYTQSVGWVNGTAQYVPGAGLITNRWDNYYGFLAQYREFEKIYNGLSSDDQQAKRIFKIAATIYLYDHTQKVVDLHGDIPFSEAGKLSMNGGDYAVSLPKYDAAEEIYTKMLDDLKAFADELKTIEVAPAIATGFATQDIVNNGSMQRWKMYCNSLRLRMLSRVSDAAAFKTRAASEIQSILADQSAYPVVKESDDNIQVDIFDLNSPIHSKDFRTGLEDWNGNIAGKAMIDLMKTTSDPRLRVLFEPGANAGGNYQGLDPMLLGADQQALIDAGTLAIYNRSTVSRNQFFPGILISAAEINLLIAEYYLKAGSDASAQAAYEKAIEESVEQYYDIRAISNDNVAGAVAATSAVEVTAYKNAPGVSWTTAATTDQKLSRIATQKWLHFNVIQPIEGWAEQRRLDLPSFSFLPDNTNAQKLPPTRWLYATTENTYNTANYSVVRAKDNLTTKLFWDVK
jgi:hypothetical protein